MPVVLVSPPMFLLKNCLRAECPWNTGNWKSSAGHWEPPPERQKWQRSGGWLSDDSAVGDWQFVSPRKHKKSAQKHDAAALEDAPEKDRKQTFLDVILNGASTQEDGRHWRHRHDAGYELWNCVSTARRGNNRRKRGCE